MKEINLISTFKHYDEEESGIKNYTIRENTKRLQKKLKDKTHIRMRRGYTSTYFTRKISHILDWGFFTIIAWRDEKAKEEERERIIQILTNMVFYYTHFNLKPLYQRILQKLKEGKEWKRINK